MEYLKIQRFRQKCFNIGQEDSIEIIQLVHT